MKNAGGGAAVPALFISDLHLSEERPAANERFIRSIAQNRFTAVGRVPAISSHMR